MGTSVLRTSHIVSGDAWGGLEAMVLDLLNCPVYRASTETTLIILNEGRFASRARALGLRIVVVPEAAMSFLALAREIRRVIADLRPDILHTHRYKEILLGAMLSGRRGPRHVVTIHGYEPPARRFTRWRTFLANSFCIGTALLRGARFVVVADHLRKRFMIPATRCLTVNNGIRLPEPGVSGTDRGARDPARGAVIGWVGRMVPVKGLSTLLKAVAEMTWAPHPTLLLAGEGPERPALESLAKSLGISERVRFLGFVENTGALYGKMDLFALPSHQEGIPMALLEAMGVGLPVVAASVGGIPQVIKDDSIGVLMDSSAPSAWAKALSALLRDPRRMQAIGSRARSHIQANFSVDAMAGRYLSLYESVMARNARDH
jgi:L-malate glycosyltransferase